MWNVLLFQVIFIAKQVLLLLRWSTKQTKWRRGVGLHTVVSTQFSHENHLSMPKTKVTITIRLRSKTSPIKYDFIVVHRNTQLWQKWLRKQTWSTTLCCAVHWRPGRHQLEPHLLFPQPSNHWQREADLFPLPTIQQTVAGLTFNRHCVYPGGGDYFYWFSKKS